MGKESEDNTCVNCGADRNGKRRYKKRCGACYNYLLRNGVDRPERLWQANREKTFCACGNEAIYKIDIYVGDPFCSDYRKEALYLCESCNRIESEMRVAGQVARR